MGEKASSTAGEAPGLDRAMLLWLSVSHTRTMPLWGLAAARNAPQGDHARVETAPPSGSRMNDIHGEGLLPHPRMRHRQMPLWQPTAIAGWAPAGCHAMQEGSRINSWHSWYWSHSRELDAAS